MVGRYFKRIAGNYQDIKQGDYLKCIGLIYNGYTLEKYGNIAKNYNCFELMPEGWTPDNVDNNHLLNLQIW